MNWSEHQGVMEPMPKVREHNPITHIQLHVNRYVLVYGQINHSGWANGAVHNPFLQDLLKKGILQKNISLRCHPSQCFLNSSPKDT